MIKNYTKTEITLQEEKEQNIQAYYNSIGMELKETTSLLGDDIAKRIYRKLVLLLPNTISSDEYVLSILASNIADFKYYCKLLSEYRKANNVEAYISIQKLKTSTSNSILTQLKSLGLTPDSRSKVTFIFDENDEDGYE
ncbi:hypothetical protein [uncultured Clostridium sp.]|uniref:hypothetical protein n=1 Tax=uncultured Clostridium sp. TaxID=59620 RepID=UPI0025E1C559|nr:hypothetical protein [uncultured Clostridium sp.]